MGFYGGREMARHKIAGKPEYRLALELTEAETAFAAEPTRENLDRVEEAYRAWWRGPSNQDCQA